MLGVGLVALAGFLFSVGVVLPLGNGARALARTEASLSRKIEEATRMYLQVPELVQENAKLRGDLQGVMLPGRDVEVRVMQELDEVASELNVRVASVRPGETEPLEASLRHPVTVTVECEFPQLVRLLYEMERPEHRLWVEGVEISTARQPGGKLQANIYVAVYSQAERSEEDAGA